MSNALLSPSTNLDNKTKIWPNSYSEIQSTQSVSSKELLIRKLKTFQIQVAKQETKKKLKVWTIVVFQLKLAATTSTSKAILGGITLPREAWRQPWSIRWFLCRELWLAWVSSNQWFKLRCTIARPQEKARWFITMITQIWRKWEMNRDRGQMEAAKLCQSKMPKEMLSLQNLATVCTKTRRLWQFRRCQNVRLLVSFPARSRSFSKTTWLISWSLAIALRSPEFTEPLLMFTWVWQEALSKHRL